jgi:CRISPR-associated protein Cas1
MALINGRPFHVVGTGCVVRRRGGRLVALKDGELRASAPLTQISEVVLSGQVGISTQAMHALLSRDIPLVLLSGTGRPLGRMEPPGAGHVLARRRQLERHAIAADRAELSRALVAGKIRNQHVLLRRRARRARDPELVWGAAARLSALEVRVTECGDVAQVMGVEGGASGVYYRAFSSVLDPALGFGGRDRRSADVVNALTNYCSALLRETVTSGLLAAGLDPYVSFLHTPARGRPTLAFDLMEEWRPVLLDSTVLALTGLRAVTPDDLEDGADGPWLSPQARSQAVTRFHARLAAPARGWPAPPARRSYADQLRAQCLALRAWILGESESYEPFAWR